MESCPKNLLNQVRDANRVWIWRYVFPSSVSSPGEQDGVIRRFHVSETG
jgi:hypothetical protein